MFATATKNFVEEIDDGSLIPVSSLSDSLSPLTLVIKRNRFFPWQKPKYRPTDFTLNDLLTGDKPISPVVVETVLLKFHGTYGDSISANVEANLVRVNFNVEGKDTSKLQSSFGTLKKEEVDVQQLLVDSRNRILDMSHCLIQQTRQKHKEVFGVVKERIVTTQPCSVIEEVQQAGQLGGLLSLCGPKLTKVCVKENSSLQKDSNITMEIPPHTVLAYDIIELVVKSTGKYYLCLMSDTSGGFEVDGPVKKNVVALPCASGGTIKSSPLKRELDSLTDHFQLLAGLARAKRSSLLQLLRTIMKDGHAVSLLENILDQMCLGLSPDLGDVEDGSLKQTFQAVLDLVGQPQTDRSPSLLSATHLVVSALDEMTEEDMSVLGSCSPPLLQALDLLVQQSVVEGGVSSLRDAGLAPLTEEQGYERAQRLLASSCVLLKRKGDELQTEIINPPRGSPPTIVLCIAVRALASSGHGI
ncbi:gasdermin Eb [Hypomesus transpacificus]|uniref:gasdermin Eb n=1 Tax=Hypomesus transpacificus TaxID=137520 RepID=UPI001F07C587|nr:gasdermin Eb [Hypomesus transpacificus]XP_046887439.1 gasdermin Eb [Hypomesus transpacificus]